MTTRCLHCGHAWTGANMAHCRGCCRPGRGQFSTFATVTLFDRHRSPTGEHGRCMDPAALRDRSGQPVMHHRERMWRGPERDAASLARLLEGILTA